MNQHFHTSEDLEGRVSITWNENPEAASWNELTRRIGVSEMSDEDGPWMCLSDSYPIRRKTSKVWSFEGQGTNLLAAWDAMTVKKVKAL